MKREHFIEDWERAGYPNKQSYDSDQARGPRNPDWKLLGYNSAREYYQDLSNKHNNRLRGKGRTFYQMIQDRITRNRIQIQIEQDRAIRDDKVRFSSEFKGGPTSSENLQDLRNQMTQGNNEEEIFEGSPEKKQTQTPQQPQDINLEGLAVLLSNPHSRRIVMDLDNSGVKLGDVKNPNNLQKIVGVLSESTIEEEGDPDVIQIGRKILGKKVGRQIETKQFRQYEVEEPQEGEIYSETRTFLDRLLRRPGKRTNY